MAKGDFRKKDGSKPSVMAKALAGLLAGDKVCHFATWFSSRYWYPRVKDGSFDFESWEADHSAMVNAEVSRLRAAGWKVEVEGQNKIEVEGRVGIVVGKPDIVARLGNAVKVVDAKTGRRRLSDWWQVLIYIYLLTRHDKESVYHGEVLYHEERVAVPQAELTDARIRQIADKMREVCASEQCQASPSRMECKMCDIPAEHCSARWSDEQATKALESADF